MAKLVLAVGLQKAGEQLLKTILTRLRQHKLPASTADMAAAHLHAMALAQCAVIHYRYALTGWMP